MNRTRLVFLLGCLFLWSLTWPPAGAAEFLQREGRFIRLTTDLTSADEANALVATFDAAVPQWIKFWNLPEHAFADWKVDACVIRSQDAFEQAGLIPGKVPQFPFGYALGNRVWVHAQQSEYYTRHLLLHEGVHSLAFQHFGGGGPTWFMEGTAEMLATHSGFGPHTRINQVPVSREAVPYWGRFKLMTQLREEKKIPSFERVLRFQPSLQGDVKAYGWSWAATMLLHAYPEYSEAFHAAAKNGRETSDRFNRTLHASLRQDWPVIAARWQLMCHDLDYGFDWQRERIALSPHDPIWDGKPLDLQVAADQGWQSAGVILRPRTKLTITPAGRVTLAQTAKPWMSEPAGITIEYRRGKPLGQLLMCALPTQSKSDPLEALNLKAITTKTAFTVPGFCWLLFRVNDGVGELADNRGEFNLSIK